MTQGFDELVFYLSGKQVKEILKNKSQGIGLLDTLREQCLIDLKINQNNELMEK